MPLQEESMPCGLWLLLVLPPLQLGVDLQGSTSPVVACEGAMPVVHDLDSGLRTLLLCCGMFVSAACPGSRGTDSLKVGKCLS